MVNIKKSLKETPYISFTPSVMWDFNGDNLWALARHRICLHLDSCISQSPELREINFCCLIHPIYGILSSYSSLSGLRW